MYNNISLSASLMCFDWLKAGQQLKEVEKHPFDYLHFDIVDGRFAPDFTMGSSIINTFKNQTKLKSDYHIMMEEPKTIFSAFVTEDKDVFTIHQEGSRNIHRDLMKIKNDTPGINVGLALSPGTSLQTLEYVIEDIDVVLLMMVDPGYKGQPLVPQTIRKVKELKAIINKLKPEVKISVDGNVNEETVPLMVGAGADILVLGSSGLFIKDTTIKKTLDKIYKAIDKGIKLRNKE
ncbi:MAG: ribulose-phosphate 3-epimerase [Patescibacteria group bacterium]|nr:ribulose-phosphate 3-epimerase [Patescibacteria group bacterium]